MSQSLPALIYHNPRCSKSREALAWLRAHGIEPEIIEYLKQPPSIETLKMLSQKLKLPAFALLRTKEPLCQTLGLNAGSSETVILSQIAAHPILLERPIVVMGHGAVITRPGVEQLERLVSAPQL